MAVGRILPLARLLTRRPAHYPVRPPYADLQRSHVDSIVSIQGLSKSYADGFQALRGIDLEIRRGEIFALLGPNGAGKTTLISIVCGLVNPSAGQVRVDGHDIIGDYRAARALIGLVPQELSTDAFESVWATLRFSRGLFGRPADDALLERVLRELSLWDKRNNKISTLSGGMKRRVLIAKALVHEPKVLFLDEPTAGVDVELRHDMWQMVRRLREQGTTIILTTHYLEEAESLCRHLAIINHGRIVEQGPMRTLLAKLDVEGFLFDIDGDLPAQLPAIEGVTLVATDSHTLDVEMPRAMDLNRIFATLQDAGIRVRSMRTKSNRLEELFVRLTANLETPA